MELSHGNIRENAGNFVCARNLVRVLHPFGGNSSVSMFIYLIKHYELFFFVGCKLAAAVAMT